MSRMAIPTMDVVRFKEADVIVASGLNTKTAIFSNLGDGTAKNATLQFTNGSEHFYNYVGILDIMDEFGSDQVYSLGTGSEKTLQELMNHESSEEEYSADYSAFNGEYKKIDGKWRHQ